MEEARLAQQEEACHYTLYPPHGSDLPVELAELTALVTSLTQGYIWHRDACSLHIEAGHFEGKTRVGDCVDDEWYIVWLLREVTRQRQRWVARCVGVLSIMLTTDARAAYTTATVNSCSSKQQRSCRNGSHHRMQRIGCALPSVDHA